MRRYPEHVSFKFKNPQYSKIIRENAELIARKMGFSDDKIFELAMAVDEAYANAVEHAGKEHELEIEFSIYEDRLQISVADSGCGFDFARLKIPKTLKNMQGARGRGLSLMRRLSDGFELISSPGSGTLVKIVKYLTHRKKRERKNAFSA
ncbi:MAG: anti-sigma B factor RsbW [Candidatus Rifleibacteriota bacterium]